MVPAPAVIGLCLLCMAFGRWFSARKQVNAAVANATAALEAQLTADASNRNVVVVGELPGGRFDDLRAAGYVAVLDVDGERHVLGEGSRVEDGLLVLGADGREAVDR